MNGEVRAAADTARRVKRSTPFRVAARSGFIVSGLLHILIGVIAVRLAFGSPGQADVSGAVAQIASDPGGLVLLWCGGAASLCLCLWHLGNALLDHGPGRLGGAGRTVSSLAQGLAFGVIAATFVLFAVGHGTNSRESTSDWTAQIAKLPPGTAILIVFGAVVAGVGIGFVVRGLARSFRKKLELPPAGPVTAAVTALGLVGYVAKGVVLLLVGLLFIVTSMQERPEQSTGLDGALKGLRAQPYGVYVLTLVSVGLISYGLYLMVKARYATMRS